MYKHADSFILRTILEVSSLLMTLYISENRGTEKLSHAHASTRECEDGDLNLDCLVPNSILLISIRKLSAKELMLSSCGAGEDS